MANRECWPEKRMCTQVILTKSKGLSTSNVRLTRLCRLQQRSGARRVRPSQVCTGEVYCSARHLKASVFRSRWSSIRPDQGITIGRQSRSQSLLAHSTQGSRKQARNPIPLSGQDPVNDFIYRIHISARRSCKRHYEHSRNWAESREASLTATLTSWGAFIKIAPPL